MEVQNNNREVIVYLLLGENSTEKADHIVDVLGRRFGWTVTGPALDARSPMDTSINYNAWAIGNVLEDASMCDIVVLDEDYTDSAIYHSLKVMLDAVSVCAQTSRSGYHWYIMTPRCKNIDILYVSSVIGESKKR